MSELLGVPGALGALAIALVIFGLAPGLVLALVVRMFANDDPRRKELQAELYAVPRWERPFWVCDQIEVGLREGALPELGWQWGRHVWHRATIESGMDSHRRSPETFEVPDSETKELLRPGDSVKLAWSVKRRPGERMWVTIIGRDGDRCVGVLENCAIAANLYHNETIKFEVDDILDCVLIDEYEDVA